MMQVHSSLEQLLSVKQAADITARDVMWRTPLKFWQSYFNCVEISER
jgi:hypothetical protein